ncbi:MAG: aminofutalosine synthase MqnE [Verrucomicrobiota bacterium]
MKKRLQKLGLLSIAEKVENQTRINEEEALQLFECGDLQALGYLANQINVRKNKNRATYIFNRYINYSNLCILSCQFCSFYRRKNQPGAFEFSVEEVVADAKASYDQGACEVHIVGGLHPKLPFSYYLEMVQGIKAACPGIFVKAFTAVEIRHFADRIAKLSLQETLQTLKDHGLDSLTGGGAEIFDPTIRDQICRGKETADEWLEVHRLWHTLGGKSTCTMLYGHLESLAQRVDHLRRLRSLQDETHGFTGFIPFAFEPENNKLSELRRTTAYDDLRTLAISRIYLDNFDHITAYWVSLGLPLAQIALSYGVDDLHGTIEVERIFHMAGAQTPQQQTRQRLEKAIRETGRTPIARNTWYEPLEKQPLEVLST